MKYLLAAILGYLLGSSNMAFYLSKIKNVDLKKGGTGNLGTSNALIQLGWKAGALTFVHDLGKASLAVILARLLFPTAPFADYVAGFASVFGHCFPFYMHFKGGKGFAPYGGAVLTLNPEYGFPMLAIVIVMILIVNYVVIGNYATIFSYPVYLLIRRAWQPAILAIEVGALIFVKHWSNVKKIQNGTEKKFRDVIFKKKNKLLQTAELSATEDSAENDEVFPDVNE